MHRPLIDQSIDQLKGLYERKRDDTTALSVLRAELALRSTTKSKELHSKVHRRIEEIEAATKRVYAEKSGSTHAAIYLRRILENLRNRLIDFAKRNPLVSYKHSERGASYLRVIDELPDHLHQALVDGEMAIQPLPGADQIPKDERTPEFAIVLERAKLTDPTYLSGMAGLGEGAEDESKVQGIERALRRRVRASLGLPELAYGKALDVAAIARANGIDPSLELPKPNGKAAAHHADDNIRVLLTEDRLEARLRTIYDRYRTYASETGLHALYAVFGFVEWFEDDASTVPLHAPALLLPVHIERTLVRGRQQFRLNAKDADLEVSIAMRELMRQKFGIEVPAIADEEGVESYWARLQATLDEKPPFRVRRYVTIGILSSARMILYEDLDPAHWPENAFSDHPLLPKLLGAAGSGGSSTFRTDYALDDEPAASSAPALVLPADVSQHSAIVDVANGSSMAIEGPPGTGKSQTIANMIASALSKGQRILFVAEKQTALDVVAKRLRDQGLGLLLLEMHSDRVTKTGLLAELNLSLTERSARSPATLDHQAATLRAAKATLRRYLTLLDHSPGDLGQSVYRLVWRAVRITKKLGPASLDPLFAEILPAAISLDRPVLEGRRAALANVEAKSAEIVDRKGSLIASPWARPMKLPAFDDGTILNATRKAAKSARALADLIVQESVTTTAPIPRDAVPIMEWCAAAAKLPESDDVHPLQLCSALQCPADFGRHVDLIDLAGSLRELGAQVHSDLGKADRIALRACDFAASQLQPAPDSVEQAHQGCLTAKARLAAIERLLAIGSSSCSELLDGRSVDAGTLRCLVASLSPVASLSSEAMALRSEALGADDAVSRIVDAAGTAAALKSQRQRLETRWLPSTLSTAEADHIADLANTFEKKGFLARFLDSSFRAARREANALAPAGSNSTTIAEGASDLRSLAEYRRSVQNFERSSVFQLFPAGKADGIDSPFHALGEAARFASGLADALVKARLLHLVGTLLEARAAVLRQWASDAATDPDAASLLDSLPADRLLAEERAALTETSARFQLLVDAIEAAGLLPSAPLRPHGQSLEAFAETVASTEQALRTAPSADAHWRWLNEPNSALARARATLETANAIRNLGAAIHDPIAASHEPIAAIERIRGSGERIATALPPVLAELKTFAASLSTEAEHLYEGGQSLDIPATAAWLEAAADDAEGFRLHASLGQYLAEAESMDCRFVYDRMLAAGLPLRHLADAYELLVARTLLKTYVGADGAELERLGGLKLSSARQTFVRIDAELQKLEAQRLVALRRCDPVPEGKDFGPVKTWTEKALIEKQIANKRNHIAIRELVIRAGRAMQALRPVWLMSPTSVAQMSPPGSVDFDIVLIDEASQMLPEFAIGAIARGAQLVVVGDAQQLPPSSFFNVTLDPTLAAGDDEDDDAIEEESILDLANARLGAKRRLKWHYRSRHEALIQFSNRQFYNRDLVVFPSPVPSDPNLGVKHVYVDGLYESHINQQEAEAVIQQVLEIAYSQPERSMGVAAMNSAQRDLIHVEIERLATEDRKLRDYIESWKPTIEPFFVKNLENVQGDERDIIIISTVYGPNKDGKVVQRFGEMNKKAGHRRLNVLVTRAKCATHLVTSLRSSDIKPTETSSNGIWALQAYLTYAEGGAVTDEGVGGEPDSDFEIFVADRLRDAGYDVVYQVGVEKFRIDLGIKHKSAPGGFIAGVECDGASYHSGYTIRDRDSIRQSVLEGLGWKIWRVWSTDWWADADNEVLRLLAWLEPLRAAREAAWEAKSKVEAPAFELELQELSKAAPKPQPLAPASPIVVPPEPPAVRKPPDDARHLAVDGIDFYEISRGRFYDVWLDGVPIGEVEATARPQSAPKVYGGGIVTHKPEYRATLEDGLFVGVTNDIYEAVRKIAARWRELDLGRHQAVDITGGKRVHIGEDEVAGEEADVGGDVGGADDGECVEDVGGLVPAKPV